MIGLVMLAQALSFSPTVPLDKGRDNYSVALCQLRSNADLKQSTETGPWLLLGFQFDSSASGQIRRDSIKIHDPNGLLRGRSFVKFDRRGQGFTLIATDSWESGIDNSTALGIVAGARPNMYGALIEDAEFRQLRVRYSGSCSIKNYTSGSNAAFAALTRMRTQGPAQ